MSPEFKDYLSVVTLFVVSKIRSIKKCTPDTFNVGTRSKTFY